MQDDNGHGNMMNDNMVDGNVTDGDGMDGNVIDGSVMGGDAIGGEAVDGDLIDGDVIDDLHEDILNDDLVGDTQEDNMRFVTELKSWMIKFNISFKARNELLKILRDNLNLNYLPVDARTFILNKYDVPKVVTVSNHKYMFFPTAAMLRNFLEEMKRRLPGKSIFKNTCHREIYFKSRQGPGIFLCV